MTGRGAIRVMAAPQNPDESIDEEGLRKQVDFSIAKGAAAVCVWGFPTEFYKLSLKYCYFVADVVLVIDEVGGIHLVPAQVRFTRLLSFRATRRRRELWRAAAHHSPENERADEKTSVLPAR